MVNRQQTSLLTPAMVVDLDGTLVAGNTLIEYLLSGLIVLLRRGHVRSVVRLGKWCLRRTRRRCSHAEMKFAIAKIIGWDDAVEQVFAKRVKRKLNKQVLRLIDDAQAEGVKVVVASAAFDFYIPSITALPYVATHIDGSGQECRGEAKVLALQQWLRDNNCRLDVVVTDHTDDLPLLRLPVSRRYIINPTPETLKAIQAEHITNVEVIMG